MSSTADDTAEVIEQRGTLHIVNKVRGASQTERKDIKVTVGNWKQRVNISDCQDCTVTIEGATPSQIAVNQCHRVGVVFNKTLEVDVSDCTRVELQVLESVPEVRLDTVNDATLFIPKEQTTPEAGLKVHTSRCADVKVCPIVDRKDHKDVQRLLIPSLFVSQFNADGKLITETAR